jgi:hypothetical protein
MSVRGVCGASVVKVSTGGVAVAVTVAVLVAVSVPSPTDRVTVLLPPVA